MHMTEDEIRKDEREKIIKILDSLSDRNWDDDVFKFLELVKQELRLGSSTSTNP